MGDQQSSMDAHPIYQVSLSISFVNNFVNIKTLLCQHFQRTEYMPRPEFSPETVREGFGQKLWVKSGMNQ